MLAEAHAAEEGRAVTDPGGKAGRQQGLPPDLTHADDQDDPEEHTGIVHPGESVERANAGDLPVKHAGEERQVQAEDKAHRIQEKPHVQVRKRRLHGEIDDHDPERTPGVELFHILAVFVGAQAACHGKIQDPGDGPRHARRRDGDQDNGRFDTVLQSSSLSFLRRSNIQYKKE